MMDGCTAYTGERGVNYVNKTDPTTNIHHSVELCHVPWLTGFDWSPYSPRKYVRCSSLAALRKAINELNDIISLLFPAARNV